MRGGLIAFGGLVLLGAFLLVAAPGGLLDAIPILSWRWTGSRDIWPTIDHMDVAVQLSPPGGFAASGTLQLSEVSGDHFALVLNRGLSVTDVSAEGVEVSVARGFGLGTDYHREGRVLHFDLADVPQDGRLSLKLEWSGEAAYGPEGSDWRGILLVDYHEARMCEQTIFCPQVPLAVDGPAVQRSTFTLEVSAPAAWEMDSPGQPGPVTDEGGDRRVWRYESEQPALFSIVGGERVRHETVVGERRVVTLLRSEHADLGVDLAVEAAAVLDVYNDWFGASGRGSMCLFEQTNRKGYSYNWFANGLAVFDKGALNNGVPTAKLAHEMAHLWWGQAVSVDGPGERFLTEGLSEASSWLYLERAGRGVEVQFALDLARKNVRELAEQDRSLALEAVEFGVARYNDLAYSKGGLVHRYVLATLGEERGVAFISAYRSRSKGGVATLADWSAALAEVAPELPVPWVEHGGDFELALLDVTAEASQARVTGTIQATRIGPEATIPLQAVVFVEVVGRGFRIRRQVQVDGETTALDLAFDLPAELTGAHAGGEAAAPFIFSVNLDPDQWLPLGGGGAVVISGPRLLASAPEQGALDVGMGLTRIEVTFDEPLQDFDVVAYQAQRPALSRGVATPSVRELTVVDDGRRVILEVTPLAPGKTYRLPLRGAFRNGAGAVPFDEFLSFETAPSEDVTAPQVLSFDPPDGITDLAVTTTALTLVFDEPMQRGSGFDGSTLRALQSDGYAQPEMEFGSWDDSATVLTIPVKNLKPGVRYALPVGRPLRDLSGNTAASHVYHFATEGP